MAARRRKDEPRTNEIATKAKSFIDRVENLEAEKADYCKEINESKKIVFEDAERQGIQPKALKAILRRRKAERAEQAALEKLDIDEKAQFQAIADAFGDTPFGDFGRAMAGRASVSEAVDPVEAETREDEQFLQQIGRGGAPEKDAAGGRAG